MRKYIARRLLLAIPTLLGVSVVIFILLRIMPGDVAMTILLQEGEQASEIRQEDLARLRQQLGLNKPLYVQYWDWLTRIVRLDLGKSLRSDIPILEELRRRMPVTLELTLLTMLVAFLMAVPIGVISALRQDTGLDYFLRIVSITFLALPNFWVGVMVILIGMLAFSWIPPLILASPLENPVENLKQMVWPAFALGSGAWAIVSRMTRSSMLEVLRQDYIRTAHAKGLAIRPVLIRHGLKNAALPVVTIAGTLFAGLLGGTVIMESIFVLPGVGLYLVDGIRSQDYPVVQSVITFYALLVVVVNLSVDLFYAWLDPRIRYE